MNKKKLIGHLSVAVVMTIFGLTFIAIKVALRDIPPFTIALIRFAMASIILLPLVKVRRRSASGSLPWGKLTLMGLSGVTAFFVLQNLGLVFTTASNASLILASIPAITALLAAVFLGEKFALPKVLGIALTILGVFLIVSSGDLGVGFSGSLKGELLILGSAITWAVYTIISRSINIQVPHLLITAYSIFIGTAFLLPFSLYEYISYGIDHISLESWVAIIFLGVIASCVAFLLYNYSLTHIEAGAAAIYVNLSPFVTIIAAAYYLGERLGLTEITGGVLIITGIFIAGWKRHKPRDTLAS